MTASFVQWKLTWAKALHKYMWGKSRVWLYFLQAREKMEKPTGRLDRSESRSHSTIKMWVVIREGNIAKRPHFLYLGVAVIISLEKQRNDNENLPHVRHRLSTYCLWLWMCCPAVLLSCNSGLCAPWGQDRKMPPSSSPPRDQKISLLTFWEKVTFLGLLGVQEAVCGLKISLLVFTKI